MVIPAMRSDLKKLNVYRGAHSRIGRKYWSPNTSFLDAVWFLNCRIGSSGKKVSLKKVLTDLKKGCGGGTVTRWPLSTVDGKTRSPVPMSN